LKPTNIESNWVHKTKQQFQITANSQILDFEASNSTTLQNSNTIECKGAMFPFRIWGSLSGF
jgi:hypothetical protein